MTTWKARPTVYNGIQMRSRLEARWAAYLDAQGSTWLYEPRAYASPAGQYLPDFEVVNGAGEYLGLFFEVRPTVERAWDATKQMPIIWASDPDAMLMVVVPDEGYALVASGLTPEWTETTL